MMPVTPVAAITSLMMHPTLPFEFWLDYWLDLPIEGIDTEDDLYALWLQQRKPVLQ
jgi:hypothetical protein